MKIIEVNIPKEVSRNGLEDIKMKRLGEVVILAGKNGSGKTRILYGITKHLREKPTIRKIEEIKIDLENYKAQVKSLTDRVRKIEFSMQFSGLDDANDEKEIKEYDQLKNKIKETEIKIESNNFLLEWSFITTNEESEYYYSIPFVPKETELKSPNIFSKDNLNSNAKSLQKLGTHESFREGTLAKIQVIQDIWLNTTHPHVTSSGDEKKQAEEEYYNLRDVIKEFLGEDLGRDKNGNVTLFGLPIGDAKLSDGQKILLQLGVAIYSQGSQLENLILVLDEPENHLHPSVIIEVIDTLKNTLKNGQIWIATHSIPLLSHFDPSCIWFVENGTVKHAGRIPEKVLESLLGDEVAISKLQDFTNLPAQFATTRYAFECLFAPESVMTGSDDPQSNHIRNKLQDLTKNSERLRVLDYGAGKGRIIENINDYEKANKEELISRIEYIAYDECPNDKERCEAALSNVYGTAEKKYYNDFQVLFSDYDEGSFDVIIMCNVLHEIDPNKWLELFRTNGKISKCLKENGFLMLVEDTEIPIGEKAYQNGFLILQTPQLKKLFSITESDTNFHYYNSGNNSRIQLHLIPKSYLTRITTESRKNAIQSLSDYTKGEIGRIRASQPTYLNGKLHALYSQQFANAQLCLAEF